MGKHTGKIIGGVAGFILGGGPIGAIIGVLAGKYFVDDNKYAILDDSGEQHYDPHYIFWVSVSTLSAKISKADGVVTQEEIEVFRQFLKRNRIESDLQKHLAEVFNRAKHDAYDYEAYANDIYRIMAHDRDILAEIIMLLSQIANADGFLHPNEERMIYSIAQHFRFTAYDIQRFIAMAQQENPNKIYDVLGLTKEATKEDIKKAYRQLVKEHHPDKLASKGVPESVIEESKKRMAEINNAYDKLMKQVN